MNVECTNLGTMSPSADVTCPIFIDWSKYVRVYRLKANTSTMRKVPHSNTNTAYASHTATKSTILHKWMHTVRAGVS